MRFFKITVAIKILLFFFQGILFSQDSYTEIEELIEAEEDYQESEDRIDYLDELHRNPIDLNTSTPSQIAQIPGITEFTAHQIVLYRDRNGPFLTMKDLLKVPGFSLSLLDKTINFIKTEKTPAVKDPLFRYRFRIDRPMELPRGAQDGTYPGSYFKQYSRLLWNYSPAISGTLLQERDAGETSTTDHWSGHITIHGIPGGHSLTAGDFHLESGQGLILWGTSFYGYGNDGVYSIKRRTRSIRGNRSSQEYGMMRGVALERNQPGITYQFFQGWNQWDSTIDKEGHVTSIYRDGYHRTPLEISKHNNLHENAIGGSIGYSSQRHGTIGATYIASEFNRSFTATERDPYDFKGNHNAVFGIHGDLLLNYINVFGEIAQSSGGGKAGAGGMVIHLGKAEFIVHLRSYDRDYYNFHGKGFGRHSTENRNEQGIYLGGNYTLYKKWLISFYHDHYRYPGRTYFIPIPTNGRESMVYFSGKYSDKKTIGIRYKVRTQTSMLSYTDAAGDKTSASGNESTHYLRLNYDYQFSPRFTLRNRLEGTLGKENPDNKSLNISIPSRKGIFLLEDLRVRIHTPFTIYVQYGIFLSQKEPADFYTFRRDFTGVLSVYRLTGNGHIGTLLFTYRWMRLINCAIKYSIIRYSGRENLGTGRDLISGSVKSTAGIQMEINW